MSTQHMIIKRTMTGLTILAASLAAQSQGSATTFTSDSPESLSTLSYSDHDAIDYRHMGLYQLKQNRYYNPQTASNQIAHVQHTHHHDHFGWGGNWWGYGSGYSSSNNSDSSSFSEKVGDSLTAVAVVATAAVIVASVAYAGSQALFTLWPYHGAASLTAIELPPDSPWKITGYKTAKGTAITQRDFNDNEDTLETVKDNNMFDRQENPSGRFLLVDQENWWGLVDQPVDIDITFSRTHTSEENLAEDTAEQITVNFQRNVTNGLKPGAIKSRILSVSQQQNRRRPYQLISSPKYPNWIEFSRWYHQPTRVVVDFKEIGV